MQKFLYGDLRQLVSKVDLSKDNSSVGRDTCLCDFLVLLPHGTNKHNFKNNKGVVATMIKE